MKTLAIYSNKGGVGKTNCAVNLAAVLAKNFDQRVLLADFDPQTNVIDVHVSRLRQKIDRQFDTPLLATVRGAGYRLGPQAVD